MENEAPGFFYRVKRKIKQYYHRTDFWKSISRIFILTLSGIFAACIVFVLLVWIGLFGKLPGKDELKNIQHPIASEVYSADSVLLGRYFFQERSPVSASDLPENLKQALISTEDVRFYEHGGIDVKSLLRVLVKSVLLQRESSGGGSTITQQLAKNLYPRKSYALFSLPINKVREFIVARRLESVYSKEEILVLYLNTIPFGDNTFGIKTAADRFFSIPVKSLTPDQSAVLIGMLKATHYYNPRLYPDRAKQRRNVVLAQMEKYGHLKLEEKKMYQGKPLALHYNSTTYNAGLAPYFRAYIKSEILAWCAAHEKHNGEPYNLYTDGLKIYTTIDSRLQRYAEVAMQSQMKILQERFSKQLSKRTIEKVALRKIKQLPQYKRLIAQGLSNEDALKKLKKSMPTRIFTWEGEKEVNMSLYDSLKHHMKFLQTGILAVQPNTGEVKVWVGGIDYRYFQFDHVKESTKRQVGSTLKPIIYAAALESGIDPCDYVSARKTSYTNMEGWTPENSDEETYDRKYSMEGGLAGSVNTVSVKLLEKAGIGNAIAIARKMGIKSELPAVPSLALGTPSISVLEMVGAYCVLANNGNYSAPHYVTAIADQHGEVIQGFTKLKNSERAMSSETAQLMIHMLKSVVSEGTGSSLRTRYGVMNDVAGKTGTTQSNVDGWFMAVTPKLVIGTWVGSDDPQMHFSSTAMGQGAATALPITARFLQQVNKDRELEDFTLARFESIPESLLSKLDCKTSKNDLNIFQRIFKKKKGTKITKFKNSRRKRS
jgi:penicillin-binding protein 1A